LHSTQIYFLQKYYLFSDLQNIFSSLSNLLIFHYVTVSCRFALYGWHITWWRLHAGGGIGKARTRANDDVTCSVSDENAPPLA